MTSVTPTLLDPHEVAYAPRAGFLSLVSVDEPTEELDRASVPFSISHVALVEEINEPPPWTPEPVDRRWRARGWSDDA
jgi:hypothetical protein